MIYLNKYSAINFRKYVHNLMIIMFEQVRGQKRTLLGYIPISHISYPGHTFFYLVNFYKISQIEYHEKSWLWCRCLLFDFNFWACFRCKNRYGRRVGVKESWALKFNQVKPHLLVLLGQLLSQNHQSWVF